MACAFNLDISEMIFSVSCIYSSTKRYCEKFVTDQQGQILIRVSQQDIDNERQLAMAEDSGVDPGLRRCSDAYLEVIALLRKIADAITCHNRALMHGSAICVDGKAYVFTALSGTGKSTHTRLLRQLLGERCVMINDDKPFLYDKDGQFYVCGTPWMGKHRLGEKIIKPLAGIFFLRRSENNELSTMSAEAALPLMLSQIHRPVQAEHMLYTLDFLDRLLASVPLYDFGCNMDISAAELSSSVMK